MNHLTEKIYEVQWYKKEAYDGSFTARRVLNRMIKDAKKYGEIHLDFRNILSPRLSYHNLVSYATFIMDMERLFLYHNYIEESHKERLMADIVKLNRGSKASRFENPDVYRIIMPLDNGNTTVTFEMYERSETIDAVDLDTTIEIKMISRTGRKLESHIIIINDEYPTEISIYDEHDSSLLYPRYKTLIEEQLFIKLKELFMEYLMK